LPSRSSSLLVAANGRQDLANRAQSTNARKMLPRLVPLHRGGLARGSDKLVDDLLAAEHCSIAMMLKIRKIEAQTLKLNRDRY
jgi:hypothetical protein